MEASATPVAATSSAPPKAPASASTATEARLRVRAPGGTWQGTLPAQSTLRQVEDAIKADGKASGNLKFSQTFPRKFFTEEEKEKSLKELGLVPNAALEASAA